jgi:AcrR family transcriptional regulator
MQNLNPARVPAPILDEKPVSEGKTGGRIDREDRREMILDVATEVFLSEGYAATSMSSIAAKLGGSKGTLYNYFKSKEELFLAYVQRNCDVHRKEVGELLTEEGEARAVLTAYARRYLRVFTSEKTLQNWRVISAESAKNPEMGRMFYESGPLRGAQLLADYIDKAVSRGELVIKDTLGAAHQFLALIHGRMIKARLLNYLPVPSDDEINAEVESALFVFFSAYGVKKA